MGPLRAGEGLAELSVAEGGFGTPVQGKAESARPHESDVPP